MICRYQKQYGAKMLKRILHGICKKKASCNEAGLLQSAKKLGWKTSRHADDAISIDMLVKELQAEPYNPILLYKPQGITDPNLSTISKDGSILALQTEFQRDL